MANLPSAVQGEAHVFMYMMMGIRARAYSTCLEKGNSLARASTLTTRPKAFMNDLLEIARLGVRETLLDRGHSAREV